MDVHSFASLAHLRILLLPIKPITQSTFDKHAADIRSFDEIRLSDIPSDSKDERARFMPKPLQSGHIHLSFPSHPPPDSHTALSVFRPSHFPLGVIGVATCSQTESLSSALAEFNAAVLRLFPPGFLFPLAKNCFVFEESDGNTNLNLGDNLPGLVVIPSIMGNKKLYIGTLLADLCSNVLGEFGHVVHVLESPLGNEYLNASLFPVLPPLSQIPQTLDDMSKTDNASPSLPSHHSQPELANTGSLIVNRTQAVKRNSSAGPGFSPSASTSFRQSTLGLQSNAKKRATGFGATSSHGRLFKVTADLFLLAGRTEDALIWYTEAVALLKNLPESVWLASAYEGLATVAVVDAWALGHGLNASTSGVAEPWSDVCEKLNLAIGLYYKAAPTSDEYVNEHLSLLAFIYAICVLRHTSVLFSVWSAKGWGPLAFTGMLQPGPRPYLPPTISRDRTSNLDIERLSAVSGISRSAIANSLALAHGPWLLHLRMRERLMVLETMAGLYACLGYKRKEIYILREVLGCVMDLLVCSREEEGTSRPLSTGSENGEIDMERTNRSLSGARGSVGIRLNERTDGNQSIIRLLKYVCLVLGVDLEVVEIVDSWDKPDTAVYLANNEDLIDMPQTIHGWSELQIGVVREALAVAEALSDYASLAQFALSALKLLHPVLDADEQRHLYSTSQRGLATARRRGENKYVKFWAASPIVNIALTPLPLVRIPIEKPTSMLGPKTSDVTPILTGAIDPFLYNPRRAALGKGNSMIVQNETVELTVTLRNPYVFDLELQDLALSTTGVAFESKGIHVVIPAESYYKVTVNGKAPETGLLTIRGCIIQAPGGAPRECLLPVLTDEEEETLSRRRSSILCENGRSKRSGLEFSLTNEDTKRSSGQKRPQKPESIRYLVCKVVPEQPLLRIRRTSVTHGALMLYNGEMSTIRLTLENVSVLPITFLRLSFDDSTIHPAQEALAEGELSVFDTYETEYDLLHKQVFSWKNKGEVSDIQPGAQAVVTIECLGKVGCTDGAVHVSYSSIPQGFPGGQHASDVFYTRQLSYPVLFTVYHMLECHGMDILPLSLNEHSDCPEYGYDGDAERRTSKSSLQVDDENEWCLFTIDVRNTYGLPFTVVFERFQEGTPKTDTSSIVPPGTTARMVLPIKKFRLSDDEIRQPIPTLSDRQFVVQKSSLSPDEEAAQRELFWYREKLLKRVSGRWQESGGSRSGELYLRQQRITLPMLQTLRTQPIKLRMMLVQPDMGGPEVSSRAVLHHGYQYFPPAYEFVYVRIEVTNFTTTDHIVTVDLDVDPVEHIIYEGALTDIPVGQLRKGESQQIDIPVTFLVFGRFHIHAVARIGDMKGDGRAGTHRILAVVKPEAS